MERNKYDLHREVLTHKYADILKSFEETHDDRRIAWNCYQQLITACEAMRDSGMEDSFACCAVNEAIRKVEEIHATEMEKITGGLSLPGLF